MEDERMSSEAGGEQDVTVDMLHQAAEEARKSEDTLTREQETEREAEPKAEPTQEELAEEPADNAARTKLGMKVAAQERTISELTGQLRQVTGIINWFAEEAQKQTLQQKSQTEEDEYIPTDRKGFESFLANLQTRQQAEHQRSKQQYESGYWQALDALQKDEDDPALVSELVKLTTGAGQPFNKQYSKDASADAERNWFKAKAHILKTRIAKPPANPLKGGKPDNPLGAAPSQTVKGGDKAVQLDEYARRAARAFGMSDKQIREALES